jgi:hypothetical protein
MRHAVVSIGHQRRVDSSFSFSNPTPTPWCCALIATSLIVGVERRQHEKEGLYLNIAPSVIWKSTIDEEGFVLIVAGNKIGETDGSMSLGDFERLE